MLAIDVRDSNIVVAMPRRHGGVARMLLALEDAGLGVSRIEPRIGETGIYRLTVQGTSETAMRILEAIGCRAASRQVALDGNAEDSRGSRYINIDPAPATDA